ncbi:MAG: anaerobic sulfatase maturase, partial [Planctomycetaceae bacterium]|nr:anaerobic sulfatase maturase [Planctomycetaceae bacterium]
HGFHVMTKPIGPICNLDCEYCYYLHKEELYPRGERWRMPEETLSEYIRQYIAAQPPHIEEITFAWQGGEPTLLGLEFFERVVELQTEHRRPNQKIVNTLQTNGVLLDDRWCEFFRTNNFLIGISIDGPAELHDRYRYDKQGRPSFPAVLRGLKLLKSHQVDFNVLVVVNRLNAEHGKKVYTYLRDSGAEFLQFIPIVEKIGVGAHAELDLVQLPEQTSHSNNDPLSLVSSRSVEPEQFGDFLIEVFNEWIRRDVGRVFVQIFDQALSAWVGLEPSLCIFRKQCGSAMAMEHNGDLYSCDHFVEPEYLLGNIHEKSISELAHSSVQQQFGSAKETTLPEYCQNCGVRFVCNGECPKNRILTTPEGEPGLNYLCQGYRKFFNYIDPYMQKMAEEVRQGRPAANVMKAMKAERRGVKPGSPVQATGTRRQTVANPNRNDPCPCGSGRKFKKCCMPR